MSNTELPIQKVVKWSRRDFRFGRPMLWLCLLFFGLSACGTGSNTVDSSSATSTTVSNPGVGVSNSSINFGESIPNSSPSFSSVSAGIKAYFDVINSTGGVDGRQLRLNVVINKGTTQATVSAKKLVNQDKSLALLGSGPSSSLVSELPVYQKSNTPILGPISGSAAIHDVFRNFVFNVGPSYVTEGQAIADVVARSKNAGSVAVMYQNNSFGSELLSGYQLTSHSFPILVPFHPSDTDFSSQASMLQSDGVRTVVIFADNVTVGNILDSFDSIGFNPNVVISQSSYNANLFSTIGSGVANIYVSGFIPSTISQNANTDMQRFRKAMGNYEASSSIDQYSAWGWLDAELAVDALKTEKNRPINQANFVHALESLSGVNTLAGTVSYGVTARNALDSAYLYRLVNGHRLQVSTLQ